MATGYSKFEIQVGEVKFNNKTCTCPIVELIYVGSDILKGCKYDPDKKTIIGKIKDDLSGTPDSACVEFWVKCSEKDCIGGQRIKKCVCNSPLDCKDCEDCTGGFCSQICPPEQCYDNQCRECNDSDACECNKNCNYGYCECETGKKDCGDGCCSECCPDDILGPCFVCENGLIVTRDCGEGQCDIDLGCVDCINVTGCGTNECCVNNNCDCCEGYVRDNCTGECVILPFNACKDDGSCTGCTECTNIDSCTGYGTCNIKECPPGYVCVGDDCKKECDCSTRDCSSQGGTSSCADHPSLQGVCYCTDCSERDCPQSAGSDCGPSSDRDACGCVGDDCLPNSCNGRSCSEDSECPFGCTCYRGTCISCAEFSCTEQGSSACGGINSRNCQCASDGTCEGNPNPPDCADTLTITKDEESCELVGAWQAEDCCKCPDIKVEVISDGSGGFTYNLHKNSVEGLNNRLGNTSNDFIADTENPTGGGFQVSIEDLWTEDTYDSDGKLLTSIPFTQTVSTDTADQHTSGNIKDTTSNAVSVPTYDSPPVTVNGQTVRKLRNRVVVVKLLSPLRFKQFEGTGCQYGNTGTILGYLSESNFLTAGYSKVFTLTSNECKPTLFVWKQDGVAFRKRYINTPYIDTVGIEEGLRACKDVTLEVDCGCEKFADEDSTFCNPLETEVLVEPISPCNTKFAVTIPESCALNYTIQPDGTRGALVSIDFGKTLLTQISGDNKFISTGTIIEFELTNTDRTYEFEFSDEVEGVNIEIKCCR